MNDFTRDELNVLLKCARLTEIDFGNCADIDNVIYKIQSMIDNYCNHEWDAAYAGPQGNHFKCHKCDKGIP
jgi:hypothetical protein